MTCTFLALLVVFDIYQSFSLQSGSSVCQIQEILPTLRSYSVFLPSSYPVQRSWKTLTSITLLIINVISLFTFYFPFFLQLSKLVVFNIVNAYLDLLMCLLMSLSLLGLCFSFVSFASHSFLLDFMFLIPKALSFVFFFGKDLVNYTIFI